jgi:hypothetical protein
MLRTARLTDALRGRSKTLAVSLGAAAALAGAGSAAVLSSGTAPAAHHDAAQHAPASKHASFLQTRVAAVSHAAPAASAVKASPVTHATAAVAPAQHSAPPAQSAPAQNTAPSQAPAQPAPPAQPTTIYDSVTPSSIPAGQQAAVYSDGSYAASPAQVAGHPNTLWIDTNGSNPKANALDVEPGDATPQQAGQWVYQKLSSTPKQVAIVYTMRSDWQATQAAIGQLPPWMQSHVKWWIADPTGVQHMVPGANATQWYWGQNYDITTANPGF